MVAQELPALPTAAQMAADPTVSAAIAQAWADSQAGDPDNRHRRGDGSFKIPGQARYQLCAGQRARAAQSILVPPHRYHAAEWLASSTHTRIHQ